MRFNPICFMLFIDQYADLIEYVDNWGDAEVNIRFFNDELPIDMDVCIEIEVAEMYMRRLGLSEDIIDLLQTLDCPCV